jgi:hypothetical protein
MKRLVLFSVLAVFAFPARAAAASRHVVDLASGRLDGHVIFGGTIVGVIASLGRPDFRSGPRGVYRIGWGTRSSAARCATSSSAVFSAAALRPTSPSCAAATPTRSRCCARTPAKAAAASASSLPAPARSTSLRNRADARYMVTVWQARITQRQAASVRSGTQPRRAVASGRFGTVPWRFLATDASDGSVCLTLMLPQRSGGGSSEYGSIFGPHAWALAVTGPTM